MNKLKLLIRMFLLVFVVMVVYIISQKADIIKGTIFRQLGMQYKAVAGARTGPGDEIAKTVNQTVAGAKNYILQIKIGDMIGAAGQAAKLGSDVQKQADHFLKSTERKK